MKKIFFTFVITTILALGVCSYFPQVPNWISKNIFKRTTTNSTVNEDQPAEETVVNPYAVLKISKRAKTNATITNISDYLDDASYEIYNQYVQSMGANRIYTHVVEDVVGIRFGSSNGVGRLSFYFRENIYLKSVKLEYELYREDEPLQYGNLIRNDGVEFNALNKTYYFDEPADHVEIGYPDGMVGRFILTSISLELVEIIPE